VFERFTDRARRVLVLAQEEARLLGHGYIGTEHLLLGLIHEGEGIAARVLESLGISLEAVRVKVDEIIAPAQTEAAAANPPFTPRTKLVLDLSLREALQLGHNYIGTEHILLGLVREGDGVAAQVLQSLGADLPTVRQAVISQLTGYEDNQPLASPISDLAIEVDWPRHPIKVISGTTETLTSQGITFRVIGVLLYDDSIEVTWRFSGVPEPLIELLNDRSMIRSDRSFERSEARRSLPLGPRMQRRVFQGGGRAIVTTRRRPVGGASDTDVALLKISIDGGPDCNSALGDYEPQGDGELAGRSYFAPAVAKAEHSLANAQSVTLEWQGQSIEIGL
jgi:hypothetical protein